MGRARGQRPSRPRGAIERVAPSTVLSGTKLRVREMLAELGTRKRPDAGVGDATGMRGIRMRSGTRLRWPGPPAGGFKPVRPQQGHPPERSRITIARSVGLCRNGISTKSFRAQPGAPHPSPTLQRPFRVRRRSRGLILAKGDPGAQTSLATSVPSVAGGL
jgi:hypothetical protein